jgi:phage recombination protein Bet
MNAITTTDDKPSHDEVIRVLENSLYPGAKRESIELVLAYCRANGLDPMLRPVYIVPTSIKKPDGSWETRDVLMPGIADYRIKAARSGEYGGKSEPEFGPDVRETLSGIAITYPAWCRITVRRIVQGHPREFTATERWVENYATAKRDTQAPNAMWKKRPYGQLAKVAEAQALRMAFPEFSAGYTMEEMQGKTGQDDWAGTTIEGAREASPGLRDAINAEVPLKAAAAAAPRQERKVDPAVYDAEPVKPTNGNGQKRIAPEDQEWLDSWQTSFDAAMTIAVVKDLEASAPYVNAIRKAPPFLVERLREIVFYAYQRLQPKISDPAALASEEPSDEVPIDGEKYAAA